MALLGVAPRGGREGGDGELSDDPRRCVPGFCCGGALQRRRSWLAHATTAALGAVASTGSASADVGEILTDAARNSEITYRYVYNPRRAVPSTNQQRNGSTLIKLCVDYASHPSSAAALLHPNLPGQLKTPRTLAALPRRLERGQLTRGAQVPRHGWVKVRRHPQGGEGR